MVVRNNQVVPDFEGNRSDGSIPLTLPVPSEHLKNQAVSSPIMSRSQLPALQTPQRCRLISELELANALTILKQQQEHRSHKNGKRPHLYRRRRRSMVHRTKTPALSPIRESGLSNPASPSHQNCTVSAINSTCTRPH